MTFVYILLPLFGALPLIIIIFKMRRALSIKKNGISTEAVVVQINSLPRRLVIIILEYTAGSRMEIFKGKATASYGQFKLGDKIPILYSPDNPSKMTLKDQKGHYFLLVLAVLLFLFIIFATFKIEELMHAGY